ncbi:hypothetical protein DSCOOX_51610 [Desulfosarcina ovata subsp. ovata]|uniref:Uncharacterized protein n=1 Tax=Desulfosarcina ovata subsp. ovata TaxID=2752305 RepID=A0A5K8AH77_9BACT|nr:NAD(P)H-dependent oxidoreductase [Desulfosarcina ovata]BBO91981.1 hypothetical protein DSCOOX_51610 [Desulfosarcina ovata subsp. ovata]
MKVLGVSGSPIKNSNTDRALKAVLNATECETEFIKLIWLNTCQEKNLSIPKKLGPIIFIERLDRGGVCNNDGRAL